jgi:hypothetical protein
MMVLVLAASSKYRWIREFIRPMQLSKPERIKSLNKVVFNDIRISAESDRPSK